MNAKRGWTLEPYFFERDNVMEKFAVCVKNGSKTINVEIVVRRCSSKFQKFHKKIPVMESLFN